MSFREIVGHVALLELLARAVERETLPPSLIFAGPEGVGKRTTAIALAQALNCERPERCGDEPGSRACGTARVPAHRARRCTPTSCVIEPGDSGAIKVDQVREAIERAAYRPFEGRRRVVIVDEADALLPEAQNALLKTLEEPPPASVFVLVTARPDVLLPTVRSRCQRLRFGPLRQADVADVLIARSRRRAGRGARRRRGRGRQRRRARSTAARRTRTTRATPPRGCCRGVRLVHRSAPAARRRAKALAPAGSRPRRAVAPAARAGVADPGPRAAAVARRRARARQRRPEAAAAGARPIVRRRSHDPRVFGGRSRARRARSQRQSEDRRGLAGAPAVADVTADARSAGPPIEPLHERRAATPFVSVKFTPAGRTVSFCFPISLLEIRQATIPADPAPGEQMVVETSDGQAVGTVTRSLAAGRRAAPAAAPIRRTSSSAAPPTTTSSSG